jgi:hypothetical protein
MLDNIKDIYVGKGIGLLTFGNTQEQVLAVLGEPAEREKYSLSELDNDDTEAWHYDDLDLSLSFDQESDWQLSSIAISSDEFLLDGQPLVGKSRTEIEEVFDKMDWEPEEDDEVAKDDPACCLIHIDAAGLSFWLENDVVTEIQVGQIQGEL